MRKAVVVSLGLTAVGNVVGGLCGLLAPDLAGQAFYAHDVSGDPLLLRFHMIFWLFVVALGVGYGVAARRVMQGHDEPGLLIAGGLGKIAASAVWVEMYAHGLATPTALAAVAFDGSLGVLFLARALTVRR